MAKTHTHGPWIIDHNLNHPNKPLVILGRSGNLTIIISDGLGDGPEAEANARLIAAAPELLAMLTEATRISDSGRVMPCDTIRAARAAIAKATL
jgi:hypothetical protein